MAILLNRIFDRPLARYALAAIVCAASYLLRRAMMSVFGVDLPVFLTFYPTVILVAVVGGLGPGLVATALSVALADYLIIPPFGSFAIARFSDAVALAFFSLMGVLISLLAERYRENQRAMAAVQVEQATWESRAKLEAALAGMTDAFCICDPAGRLVHANEALATFHRFASLRECPASIAEFQKVMEIQTVDGSELPPEMWSVARALRGESAKNVEYRLRRRDTGETWIGSYSFNPLRDPEGAIAGAVLLARDITDLKKAEQELQAKERELSLIYENMHDMIFYLAVEPEDRFRIVRVNASFLRATGLEPGQVVGKLVEEVVPLDDVERSLEGYREAARDMKPVFWTEHFVLPAGERQAEITVSPVLDDRGQCVNLIGVMHDITRQKLAEKRIEQLNRIYSVLSDTNQTIVRVKDSQAMLEAVCGIAVKKGAFRMAWVGMIDKATQLLLPVASSGFVEGYLDEMKVDLADPAHAQGPAARCVRSGRHALCNDAEHDPMYAPWRAAAMERGYRSSAGFPLKVDGEVVGVLNLYATEPAFFEGEELKLLDEMAMDVSFALEVSRIEAERAKAEARVRQLNRVYSVLSDTNQAIVRVKDSQAMLEAVCGIAVKKGAFRMAWVGMVDKATQLLRPVASSGLVEGYFDEMKVDLADPAHAQGPAALCVHSGRHALCNDAEHDPIFAPWRSAALRRGYRSVGGFPLRVDGEVEGALVLYAAEPGFFEGEELKLLDEMAMDISFALEVNRREENRRRAEEELLRRTALFEAQVESSLDGVLVVDDRGRKILQNQRLIDMMHIPPELAENPDDALQRRFVAALMKAPEEFLAKIDYLNAHPEQISRDEIELSDGTLLDRFSSPVQDKAGNYYGRIWTFRDVTEQRKLEENLRQSQKMEALGQLSGGIAHDFNNLLTVILGCSEFIGDEVKDERLKKMVEMIAGAARRGADLTHRMLAFARRQTLQPKQVYINRLLEEVESFLHRALTAEIDLQLVPGSSAGSAVVDAAQLENALLNLCVNARDAMPGGGKLTIETQSATLDAEYAAQNPDVVPGDYVQIAVSDTGCGISPENLQRVFDPFFTTKEVGKGTGLGLSMVYGFAKQSKGHVKIYSELGQGTCVKLFLPCAVQPGNPQEPGPEQVADLRGSETILLVEDNEAVREFTRTQLDALGYSVFEACNGDEGLRILHAHPEIDLLFTDFVMPGGMNGRELAQRARQIRPSLPVLYYSGYAENAMSRQADPNEEIELLSKPFTRREIATRLRKVLGKSRR